MGKIALVVFWENDCRFYQVYKVKKIDVMGHPTLFRVIINLWPPYFGAGIKVEKITADWCCIRVSMGLHWYNRNYVNSHFGGSLFAMCDPFYMLMLLRNLGKDYIVWDMSARIRFMRPGRGRVRAEFLLSDERLQAIRQAVSSGEKHVEKFMVDVLDESGERVAVVDKTLYIRKKIST